MKGAENMEVWKDIEGFEGLYEVSSLGRIKTLHYYGGNQTRILKLQSDKNGYLTVGLHKGGVTYQKKGA